MQRRIDRGEEKDNSQGREDADDADAAGAPDPSELPESRNDRETKPPTVNSESANSSSHHGSGEGGDQQTRQAGSASGPMLAELVATRAELRRIEGELQKASEERQELLDRIARRQADFENYRKRMERERGETYARVVGEVIGHLLPVMDNLQRALDAESSVEATESEEFRHFLSGVELIGKQLNGVLEKLGVKPVETVGEKFDPHVHEAIAAEESDDFEPDTVTKEVVRGYRLGEKLLRPAMVKVAK
jgi:molecular chaperone GrpE